MFKLHVPLINPIHVKKSFINVPQVIRLLAIYLSHDSDLKSAVIVLVHTSAVQ
jgi:hypothetical protein